MAGQNVWRGQPRPQHYGEKAERAILCMYRMPRTKTGINGGNMTAKEWEKEKSYRAFAEAVKGLRGVSVYTKAKALYDCLMKDEGGFRYDRWKRVYYTYIAKHNEYINNDVAAVGNRTRARRVYRTLLRECGVESRHV
jgi:hypothetical protein